MRDQLGHVGLEVAKLAAAQHGVVAHAQLVACDVSPQTIHRWRQAGRLHQIHRGVYSVGHPLLTARGRWMGAVLAVGEGGVLSHRAAAALWELRAAYSGPIEVISMRRATPRPGIRVRRGRSLEPDEVTVVDAIRTTTVERTLLDLAAVVPERALRGPAIRRRSCASSTTDASRSCSNVIRERAVLLPCGAS